MGVIVAQINVGPLQRLNLTWDAETDQAIQGDDATHLSTVWRELNDPVELLLSHVVEPLGVRMDGRCDSVERIFRQPLRFDGVFEDLATDADSPADGVHIQVVTFLIAFVALNRQPLTKNQRVGFGDRVNRASLTKVLIQNRPRLAVGFLGGFFHGLL
nr:hypothetical protein [Rubripirellula obstinata]